MTVEEALAVVKQFLDQGRLNKIQETIFRQSWEGQSYLEIAANYGYDPGYVKDAGSKLWKVLSTSLGEKITKNNFRAVLKQRWRSLQAGESQQIQAVAPKVSAPLETSAFHYKDWGEAIDVSVFFGRIEELSTLEQWLVTERCRLVSLLGMGGSGKTALSVKLAVLIQDEFDYLIWRSLRNAPPKKELLAQLIQFLSNGQETNLPETVDGRVSRLMHYLRSSRCLLILDNVESILQSGEYLRDSFASRTGSYREGYESYGQLFRCVAETPHQSCLVLTTREKPIGLAAKEGENLPVRSLQLTGLPTTEAQKIFQSTGSFSGSQSEWEALIEHYAGNPLALKMVAPAIRDFFDSSVSKFLDVLKQGTFVFDDIRNLLDRQIERLTDLEKEVMYWLAINREPISFQELQEDLLVKVSQSELLEAVASLRRRSLIEKAAPTLIEKNSAGLRQQPFVMEYMTQQLVERVCKEIATAEISLFRSHSLIKAQTYDYVREAQIRLILKPVRDRLLACLKGKTNTEHQLWSLLSTLRGKPVDETGYAGGNILNLLWQLNVDLSDRNFSDLVIRQAYLPKVR